MIVIVPPCSVCGRRPETGERWVSVSTWVAGDTVLPEIDNKTGEILSESKPGPSHRDMTGHVSCLEPLVAPMLKKGGQA